MYFVLRMLIKIDSWGWYWFLYLLYYIWLLEFEGFNIIREFNSMFDNIFFN